MKTKLTIVAGLALSLALAACSKSHPSAAAPQKGGQTGPEWSLELKTKCLDGTQDKCVGYYGFSVDATGKYTVGAELASHATRIRALANDENQAVLSLVKPYLEALTKGTEKKESCITRPEDEPSLDNEATVTLNRLGTSYEIVKQTAKEDCAGVLDEKAAETLVGKLSDLAAAHYPTPYPDACLDKIDEFEARYAPLQTCSAATDCAYIGDDYSAIPYDANQVVALEDYTKIAPIVVANASKITAQREALTAARTALEQSCGDSLYRDPVPSEFKQFSSNAGNPLCVEKLCIVNPAVFAARRH
jgi:hypothetical protein